MLKFFWYRKNNFFLFITLINYAASVSRYIKDCDKNNVEGGMNFFLFLGFHPFFYFRFDVPVTIYSRPATQSVFQLWFQSLDSPWQWLLLVDSKLCVSFALCWIFVRATIVCCSVLMDASAFPFQYREFVRQKGARGKYSDQKLYFTKATDVLEKSFSINCLIDSITLGNFMNEEI